MHFLGDSIFQLLQTKMHCVWLLPLLVQRGFLTLPNEKHLCNEMPLKYYWPITAVNKRVATCAILSAQEPSEPPMTGVTIWNVPRAQLSPSVHTRIYRRDITPAEWCFNANYQPYWTHLIYILTFIEGVPPLSKIFNHIARNRGLWGRVMGDWFCCY